MKRDEADLSISRGVAFLRSSQLPHGEFTTLLGANKQLSRSAFDSSPFVTAGVLYALTHVDATSVVDIVEKGASFLRSEMEFGGVWRYWSSRQHKHARLPPDLDDTACISYVLKRLGHRVPDNRWIFLANRDTGGRFRTWMLPTRRNRLDARFLFARAVGFCQARLRTRTVVTPDSEDPRFRTMHIDRDDIDPVVNANVLLYLGECTETRAALQFVIEAALNESAFASLYYEDALVYYYAVARAFQHAVPALSVARDHVVSRVLQRVEDPESLNPLQAALAAATLLTFDPNTSEPVEKLVRRIAAAQRLDGGWDAYAFYNVWGSEELTTGLCLEVLARFQKIT